MIATGPLLILLALLGAPLFAVIAAGAMLGFLREGIDLQACGGTHVARTGEIGPVEVGKIEKKGKHNRRVNVRLRARE